MSQAGDVERDEWINRLANLFARHPAWLDAADRLDPAATSAIHFAHRPGDPWRLVRRRGGTELLPGSPRDADLAFRFSPVSIARLESVEGGIGDFAVALFEQILAGDVDLRVYASFPRLVRRGYLKLLFASGPSVVAFGAAHGVRTVGALRPLVAALRRRGTSDWEREPPRGE